MSITRLQQARQMYAMGQRVGRIAFGGGGSQGDGDYQGGGRDDKGSVSGSAPGAGSSHNSNTPSGADDRSSDTQQYNHYEAISRNTGVDNNPLRPAGVDPGFIKPERADNLGLNLRPYEQRRVDFLNTPYKPVNIPPFIPGSTLINTAGNFLSNLGHKKNTQFFADNVAGKYGYGYDPTQTGSYEKAYERYMKERMAGNVNAYGRPLTEGELRLRDGDGNGGQGIMDVVTEGTTDDTTDDTTTDDELILRFLGADSTLDPAAAGLASTDELRAMLLERARNLYT